MRVSGCTCSNMARCTTNDSTDLTAVELLKEVLLEDETFAGTQPFAASCRLAANSLL